MRPCGLRAGGGTDDALPRARPSGAHERSRRATCAAVSVEPAGCGRRFRGPGDQSSSEPSPEPAPPLPDEPGWVRLPRAPMAPSQTSSVWRFQNAAMERTSASVTHEPCTRWAIDDDGPRSNMSPLPSRRSAPVWSRITRESVELDTAKARRAGTLALMRPVMTLTDGRWVAITRWMPTARAIWPAGRSPTSRAATIMRC